MASVLPDRSNGSLSGEVSFDSSTLIHWSGCTPIWDWMELMLIFAYRSSGVWMYLMSIGSPPAWPFNSAAAAFADGSIAPTTSSAPVPPVASEPSVPLTL